MTQDLCQGFWKLLGVLVVCNAITTGFENFASAQIVPDNTLGNEKSQVTNNPNIGGLPGQLIKGGAIRGINLFQSFSQFNVGNGERVYFANPAGIENILSRVTGNDPSRIFGLLGVNGNANLFLINPNGIIFGQNARLDVAGSFVGTTASALRFGEQGVFSATNPEAPPLLTVNPSALFFNQLNPGAIANQGILTAPPGQSLVLAGGDISFNNGLMAVPGGRIELAAIAGTGTVGLNPDYSLSIPANLPRADVSLFGSQIGVSAGNSSGVAIHARNLNISGNSYIASGIGTGEPRNSQTGDITLNATGTIQIREGSQIENNVFENQSGNSSDIRITAGSLFLNDKAQLRARVDGQGNAGSVIINARDQVSLDNGATISGNVGETGKGNGGNIRISTGTLSVTNGATMTANIFGQGNAGDIVIDARDRVFLSNDARIINSIQDKGIGSGGNIRINTGSLSLSDDAAMRTYTSGQGNAGDVIINARDQVSLDNDSDITSAAESSNGGNIRINTGSLSITKGAQLYTYTFGQGKAGDILIDARDRVSFDGGSSSAASGAFSQVASGATGQGGNIRINTGSLSATGGAQLSTYTFGQGKAGDILIDARARVSFEGRSSAASGAFSQVASGATGQGGNIEIATGSVLLDNGAQIFAITSGKGNAGDITINARDQVALNNRAAIANQVEKSGSGKGGDIHVNTGTLTGTNFGVLQAETLGRGNAGNVVINARTRVEFAGSSDNEQERSGAASLVRPGAVGNSGNVEITTGSLFVGDRAAVSASTDGKGNAGNVIINARDRIFLDDGDIYGGVDQNAVGKGGDIFITTSSLEQINGSQIDASTFGDGDAGNISIVATQPIIVAGIDEETKRSSAIFSTTGDNPAIAGTGPTIVGKGKGGNITITAPQLTVRDGAVIDARTFNNKPGGNISITLDTLQLLNGGQIFTTSESSGSAGTITINAKNKVDIAGSDPTYSSRLSQFPRRVVQISPNSSISVRSSATGPAGNIIVNTPRLTLDNQGTINAESNAVDGGNITLNSDLLLLRHNSSISTTAGLAQGAGKGGNININSQFLVAIPQENSDIIANAFTGSGGKVKINTSGIYGLQILSGAQLRSLNANSNPRELPTNDISAVSQQGGPQLDGQITINNPDVDLSNGFVSLPVDVFDPSDQIAQGCAAFDQANASDFKVTGRGGLPPSPDDTLSSDAVWEDTRLGATTAQRLDSKTTATKPKSESDTVEIIPATGWVFNGKGEVILVSHTPNATAENLAASSQSCRIR
ncbi:filamentous hemagglutinin outer membrane protein [Kalymmatonema gypsitolerans NIES-4073]|nr:filamentous hemagglutinin outer membrane protein [Scytonema sp. NIES-4073]